MLRPRRRLALACVLAASIADAARAQDEIDGLQRPERLTIGTSDQFLGTMSADEKTLYFASNRNTATELYVQDLAAGTSSLLFDEGADLTWPRVSPDGKQLLYISFRNDAAGQLCVRALPHGERRCLSDPGAVQAQWMGVDRVLLLSRPSTQGDMRLSAVNVGTSLVAHTLCDRNLASPALSPDGRWLVYTPLERYVDRIGPGFAATAGHELVAQRLDALDAPPTPLILAAPGLTGQAAFSLDGKWLYFVQFISDSNQDGVIDAGDHGVLFRVPFDAGRSDAGTAVASAAPEQLTDASWNCQYPSASTHRLLATCARGAHLDIYALSLEGMVPSDWDAARLRGEAEVTTSDYELLLLHAHVLRREHDPSLKRAEMVGLVRLHLRLDQFEAAAFHAKELASIQDPATGGLGSAMRALVEHRRALRAREHGRLSLDFADESRKRIAELAIGTHRSPAGDAAKHVVRSEIADVLGDKTLARGELEAVNLEAITLPAVLALYGDRADALYRELDDGDALFAAQLRLAEHPALSAPQRVAHARAAIRALTRGLSRQEADARLAAITTTSPGTELAFALELWNAVRQVEDAHPSPAVREGIVAFYREQTTPERRRAVMLDAMQRGYERGAQGLIEHLAELYVADVPRGTVERRRASHMYRRLIEDRAYARLGRNKRAEARDDFLAVARATGSLESWTGYLDERLREGASVDALAVEAAQNGADPHGSVGRYVAAYLIARKLPMLAGVEAEHAVDRAIALVRGAWPLLKDQPEALSVVGAVLHERFLHTGDRASAQRASALYLMALDLARRNPRYRAMLLGQMAELQAEVGNWRIALDYLDQREKLPFVDNTAGLAHRLVKAQTLLHVEREADAATEADKALDIVERAPKLATFRLMALDRAALYNLAADRYARALSLYDRLSPLVRAERGVSAGRNRIVVELARAAAALGAARAQNAIDALTEVDRALAVSGAPAELRWAHATAAQALLTYRLIASGLRAKAELALGHTRESAAALALRHRLFEEQIRQGAVDEHLRALSLVEDQEAELALAGHDGGAALRHAKAALERLEPVVQRAGKPVDHDQITALLVAAEARMSTDAHVQLRLRNRLRIAIDQLRIADDPDERSRIRWLEIYLGMLGKGGGAQPEPKR